MLPVVTVVASLLTLTFFQNRSRIAPRAWMIASVLLLLAFSARLSAQQSKLDMAAPESATIGPSNPNAKGSRFRVDGHRFETTNTSLIDLISFAYGVHATQITGVPAWLRSEKYDVSVEANGDALSGETLWRAMLQKCLAETFQLRFHRDIQTLPVYVLTAHNMSSRLARSKGDPDGLPALSITLGSTNAANANVASVHAVNASMADLAAMMQRVVLEWPVRDETGIAGRYDFALNWTPGGSQFGDAQVRIPTPVNLASAPPDLPTALQRQMGIKLNVLDAPIEVLVVDHVESPSEI